MKGRNCSCPLPPSTFASSSSCFSSSSSSLGLRSAFAWAALILFLSLSCFFGAAESALFYASPGQLSSFTSIHRQPPQQHWKQSLKDELTCHTLAHHQVECNGTKYEPVRQHDTTGSSRFYVDLSVSIGLVAFAGLMSGLTMGLMSIDRMGLKILKNGGGTAREQKYAKRIYPLVKRHHLLLVTLLIANAAAMEALPIFLDRLVGPIYAILISITAILIAGEIIPQAVCTRWGLAIGAYLSWLVWILIVLLGVVSYPISLLLDYLLGSQGTFYRRKELKQLVHLHGEEYHDDEEDIERNTTQEHGEEEKLCQDEVNIIKGALDMTTKSVTVPMTPIQKVWMLSDDARLDDATMDAILEAGHSRIPIYRGKDRGNIIGMLLVKSLIKVDPKAAVPIKSMDIHRLPIVDANMQLYPMLHFFQSGRSTDSFSPKERKRRQI
ncbi:CNNM transmembrane domain-containing protein, variant 3 [Balamuthia mandrillaris]